MAKWIWKCVGKLQSEGAGGMELPEFEAKKGDFAKILQKLEWSPPAPPPRLRHSCKSNAHSLAKKIELCDTILLDVKRAK